MTEAEAVTVAQGIFSNAHSVFTTFLALLSGYLIVAHLSGKNLTFSQVTIITTLYIIATSYSLYGWQGFMSAALHYQGIAANLRGSLDYSDTNTNLLFGQIICATMVLASLKYMWDVRH